MNDIHQNVARLEEVIAYKYKDRNLAVEALTHSSYANERKLNKIACNERLEYLGDAVLELVTSDYIYRNYPDMPEGKMSRLRADLVCEGSLSESAARIGLGELILLGVGEEHCGGRNKPSVTSDAFEAVIGSLYLDGGMEAAKRFIDEYVLDDVEKHSEASDPKSALQEFVQAKKLGIITYKVTDETGPEHAREYTVDVLINDKVYGTGKGRNKKTAEKNAAKAAVGSLRCI